MGRHGVWTGQLRQTAGSDESKSMSGVFKAIGGRFRSVGLKPLWNGGAKDFDKGQKLSGLNDDARLLFADLIRSHYPEPGPSAAGQSSSASSKTSTPPAAPTR